MSYGAINTLLVSHWKDLSAKIERSQDNPELNGRRLNLATLVAIARNGAPIKLSNKSIEGVVKSADMVQASLDRGEVVYGVNTGFGGSADTRTSDVQELQKNLLRMLQFGVISSETPVNTTLRKGTLNGQSNGHKETSCKLMSRSTFPLDDPVSATSMPESWVRASILIRLNSLASGVSGVKETTIRTLHQLLECGITPQVPIKGSISASGDLSPLSYLGGAIQGKPGLNVWVRDIEGKKILRRADIALAEHSITPVVLGAKEGLALVNGTAVSAAVGALALHEALGQAALSQVLTAMSVEALLGTDESFDPLFAAVRPHPGQIEVAENIFSFLQDSLLVQHGDNAEEGELRQDRYAVRTASQWIGPVLEDLNLAHQQITIEMNSATDNPLIDPARDGKMLHGGNFQAKAVTSAMEKTRQSLQTIGRMLFAQCTEMINPATNRGLPPNLVAGEPSASFIWKGTDIMLAALQAELGFLANPVGTHVQTAEMGNQAINSLALISGRYTLEAVQTLSQLSAAHLVAACQALDIRAMNLECMKTLAPIFNGLVATFFRDVVKSAEAFEALQTNLWPAFQKALDGLTSLDSDKRFAAAIETLQPLILKNILPSAESVAALFSWTEECTFSCLNIYNLNRASYFANPDATPYLGSASCAMYKYLRNELEVPFIGNSTITTPTAERGDFIWGAEGAENDANKGDTMGGMITKVFESMRNGEIYHVVMKCLPHARGVATKRRADYEVPVAKATNDYGIATNGDNRVAASNGTSKIAKSGSNGYHVSTRGNTNGSHATSGKSDAVHAEENDNVNGEFSINGYGSIGHAGTNGATDGGSIINGKADGPDTASVAPVANGKPTAIVECAY